jgi:hypothetical protein
MTSSQDFSSFLFSLSKQTGIPSKKVMDFFYLLSVSESLHNTVLLQSLGVSKSALNSLKELSHMYLERASDVTALLPSMKPLIQGFFPSDYSIEESFLHFYSENTFSELLQKFSQIVEQRLPPDRHLDQFLATAETVVRRALLFQFFQDVSGKRIALLGDDDFTSVALTLLNPAVSVTVFEIDESIYSWATACTLT